MSGNGRRNEKFQNRNKIGEVFKKQVEVKISRAKEGGVVKITIDFLTMQ